MAGMAKIADSHADYPHLNEYIQKLDKRYIALPHVH